jgi:hypothetical protein
LIEKRILAEQLMSQPVVNNSCDGSPSLFRWFFLDCSITPRAVGCSACIGPSTLLQADGGHIES